MIYDTKINDLWFKDIFDEESIGAGLICRPRVLVNQNNSLIIKDESFDCVCDC
jgi:hypothetical protein